MLILDNPEARAAGSVFAIGHTNSMRFMTLVLQPDESRPTMARHDRLAVHGSTDRSLPTQALKEDDAQDSTEPTSDDLDRLPAADLDAGERIAQRDDIQVLLEVEVDPRRSTASRSERRAKVETSRT